MQQRPFGSSGLHVPVVGQGTWQLRRPDQAEAALRAGVDLGLTHIDTAELYRGSEEVVARAIAGRRDDVFLVSKVMPGNASYEGTIAACEASLKRLRTDHIDVYLLHWWEASTNLGDWARAMSELQDRKRIRHIGVSNFDVAEIEAAQDLLGKRSIVCDQVYYDMDHRHIERDLVPFCAKNRIAVVGYSPFGSGRFPGPKTPGGRVLQKVAEARGQTPYQVVLAFLARHPSLFVIPKSENPDHVRANAAALDVPLSKQHLLELEAAFPAVFENELPVI